MAQHGSDNSFVNTVQLIYAFGQEGVDFYTEDELKYHSGNRGSRGKSYQKPEVFALKSLKRLHHSYFLEYYIELIHCMYHAFI